MSDNVSATATINASADAIFAALADPTTHADVDGTGWIRDGAPSEPLTAVRQVFRMPMYHPDHPDGDYETANQIRVFEPPTAIAWATGYDADDGTLGFGGWFWRYDLLPDGPATVVTLTYDWTDTSDATRKLIGFPPFRPDHLSKSLDHLAEIVRTR